MLVSSVSMYSNTNSEHHARLWSLTTSCSKLIMKEHLDVVIMASDCDRVGSRYFSARLSYECTDGGLSV